MTETHSIEVLDLRHFSARQLRPLLEQEAALWEQRLGWDYRASIELLLQSKRSGNKSGGGGGSNPGGGGRSGASSESALADFGPGSDAQAVVAARPVGQATGVAGQQFPDEFKSGLDSYFGLLEKQSAGK